MIDQVLALPDAASHAEREAVKELRHEALMAYLEAAAQLLNLLEDHFGIVPEHRKR